MLDRKKTTRESVPTGITRGLEHRDATKTHQADQVANSPGVVLGNSLMV